jgi:hypothetical protein
VVLIKPFLQKTGLNEDKANPPEQRGQADKTTFGAIFRKLIDKIG